jgi:hypothetical protein
MSALQPFSLRIFVADGDPDGLRVVERSNWIGKALIFPRALLPTVKKRDELGQTGVYLHWARVKTVKARCSTWAKATPSARGWRATMPRKTSGAARCASWPRRGS